MKISITGATGFIGTALCNELQLLSCEVAVLTRKEKTFLSGVTVFCGDLLSESPSIQEFVNNSDVVIHCAGEVKNEGLMEGIHIKGTTRLLQAVGRYIRTSGKAVHWVQLSSVGAYGAANTSSFATRRLDENSIESPMGVYESTKTASDRLVREFAELNPLFSFTILRPTIVIGSRMPNESFHAMARMIKRGFYFRIGYGQAMANYIDIFDVVRALVQCATDVRARNRLFIISNDCLLESVVEALARAVGVPTPSLAVPEGLVRFLVKGMSPWVNLPLTANRIDALTGKTYYSSVAIKHSLSFTPLTSIPELIPILVSESVNRLELS